MKRIAVCILATLSLLAFVPQRKALPGSAKGETRYVVHYKRDGINAKMATCTLTLKEGVWQDTPAYNATFSIRAANVFKLFLLSEYKVSLLLSKDDMHPYYYSFQHKKKGRQRHLEFFYKEQEVESVLQIEGQSEPIRHTYPIKNEVTMEVASFAFFLRCLEPAVLGSGPLRVKLLMASVAVPSELRYIGEDHTFWPGEDAHHYVVKMLSRGLMENGAGDEIHVWISSKPEHSIRGLEVILGKGSVTARMELP